ncbi:MAG: DUF4893 domain-containing protein [Brevundimonas sp.]|uniref:DUF4893 domain-containing protein n=1 Tax=Brevundimonas sp. TaxID=1871086 RepID=UPI00391C994C
MLRSLACLSLSVALIGGCASVPPPPAPPPLPGAPGGGGPIQQDWRTIITSYDRDRLNRLDAAWSLALAQARRQEGSGDLRSLGRLIDPDAAQASVTPPPGEYRCRTIKLGSQSGESGLGYVVYGWFQCRIEQTPGGLKLSKLTGSQRQFGLFFSESPRRMVFLGSLAIGNEPPATSYGLNAERDIVGVLERVEPNRWRLVMPWPQYESNLDILELVPAS